MAGHTPGEWMADFHHEVQVGDRFTVMVHGGNRLEPIAAVPAGVVGHGREEGRANARLIAAAPELLSIAQRWAALDAGDWHVERHAGEKRELLADTRAAIAKATEPQA